jgi:hypothetical protein
MKKTADKLEAIVKAEKAHKDNISITINKHE